MNIRSELTAAKPGNGTHSATVALPGDVTTFYEAFGIIATPATDVCPILATYRCARSGALLGWVVDTTEYPGPLEAAQRFEAWQAAGPSGYLGAAPTFADALEILGGSA